MPDTACYQETLRPQFHFTAKEGWLNDPNGLVYLDGEYHLFYQHNPFGTDWGNMTWGHAVSPDLLHWRQQPNALEPDEMGTMFSGSAAIDHDNSAGFGAGAMVLAYTAAGHCVDPNLPFTQCLAYSTDGGKAFAKYAGNPVLEEQSANNRDPRIFWHEASRAWIMVLFVDSGERDLRIYRSDDLKSWTETQRLPGFWECPELFELDGRWVIFGAHGCYRIGDFDGYRFTPQTAHRKLDYGPHFFAAQTWNNVPDGRRLLITWMRGATVEGMPFNCQMGLPCELSLDGDRLIKQPLRELGGLVVAEHERLDCDAELLDVDMHIELNDASLCRLNIQGFVFEYLPADQLLCFDDNNHVCPLALVDGKLDLRLVIDRGSIEIFANGGRTSLTLGCYAKPDQRGISFNSYGGEARLEKVVLRELRSAWTAEAS